MAIAQPTALFVESGQRYGRLLVLATEKRKDGQWNRTFAKCVCDCGTFRVIRMKELKNGHTSSCGCLHKELMSLKFTTHGKTKRRAYRVWAAMKERCGDENAKGYNNYGGRGIRVCEEWESFESFWSHISKLFPVGEDDILKGLSLERIDNDGDYCPSNVRLATRSEQGKNTRRTHFLVFNGERLCLLDWCRRMNLPYDAIRRRLKRGVPVDVALTKPLRPFHARASQWR